MVCIILYSNIYNYYCSNPKIFKSSSQMFASPIIPAISQARLKKIKTTWMTKIAATQFPFDVMKIRMRPTRLIKISVLPNTIRYIGM